MLPVEVSTWIFAEKCPHLDNVRAVDLVMHYESWWRALDPEDQTYLEGFPLQRRWVEFSEGRDVPQW